MVKKSKSRSLNLLMNGLLIGKLIKKSNASLELTYDQKWLNTPGSRPVSLSLPLIDRPFTGNVVYNFFDNLLPDNPEIRGRIQAKFHAATDQPFDLLENIGRDCVGAIQLIGGEIPTFKKEIKYESLNEKEIASSLRSYISNPLGMTDESKDFRISLAGAQEKSAFLYHKKKWCRPIGETPTTHIFKLPIGHIKHNQIDLKESCENEWLCAQIADAFGLPVAKCEIAHFEDIKVLIVERFDRKISTDKTWMMRLPQEDMCQALGLSPNLKYQSDGGPGIKDVMQLLLGSANPAEDRDMFYRAQVLFWLLAAIDGHAKNFSVFIEPGGKYRLTPLYDILSAHPLIANKDLQVQKVSMAMALIGKNVHYKWFDIQRRHFIQTAKAAKYSTDRAVTILDEMLERVDSVIESVKYKLPKKFPSKISTPIFKGMVTMRDKLKK